MAENRANASWVGSSSRMGWIDCAKGVGITLVVFGHAWRGLGSARILDKDAVFWYVDRWVYSFHMPLFFFLSGLFLVRSTRKGAARFFREKSIALLYPFVVWTVLLVFVQSMLAGAVNHRVSLADLPQALFIKPVLWFLPALFLTCAVVYVAAKVRGLAAVCAVLAAMWVAWAATGGLGGWTPVYFLGENGLYAGLGAAFATWAARPRINSSATSFIDRPIVVIVAGVALALLLTACVVARFDKSPWLGPLPALIGIAGALLLARQLDRGGDPVVRRLGELSLPIYLASTFAMSGTRIVLQRALRIEDPTIHLLFGTAAGLAFPVLLCAAARHLNAELPIFGCLTPAPNAAPARTMLPHVEPARWRRVVAGVRRKIRTQLGAAT